MGCATHVSIAQYVRVPNADGTLLRVPNKLADKEWLFLSDTWPIAWAGLTWSGFEPGDSVAVFGAGPVGLLCAYSAILRGASTVFIIDHVDQRLGKATSIGAVPINFMHGRSASEQILAIKPEGVERCVDCCGEECINAEGKPQQGYILSEAVKVTRHNGGIGVAGMYLALPDSAGTPKGHTVKPTMEFPISDFWFKSLSIRGGIPEPGPPLPMLVELVKSGRARPGFIVSAEFDIDEAPEAYRRFDRHLEIKVVFKMEGTCNASTSQEAEGEAKVSAVTGSSETV